MIKEAQRRKQMIKSAYEEAIAFLEEHGEEHIVKKKNTQQLIQLKHMSSISSSKSP